VRKTAYIVTTLTRLVRVTRICRFDSAPGRHNNKQPTLPVEFHFIMWWKKTIGVTCWQSG